MKSPSAYTTDGLDESLVCGRSKKGSTMSQDYHSLSHSKWDCKYHLVFIPKHRKQALYGQIRPELGKIFHALAAMKECTILEGHVMPDHVHMLVEIPPKHAVSAIVGFLKGKSAIAIARQFSGRQRNFTGENFWARVTPFPRSAPRKKPSVRPREQEGADRQLTAGTF
jgi:putative transposase